MFSFMAYANLATSPKRLETKLANITRRHFCSLPVFCIEHFLLTFSFRNSFPLFVCFDILWQLATTHATGTKIVRAKMTLLDGIFCRGNKSSSRSLARFCSFCRRKHKKSTARASRSWKKVTSTCRRVHGRGSTHKRIYKAPARRILAPFFFIRVVFLQLRLVLIAIYLNSKCQTVTTTIVITSN